MNEIDSVDEDMEVEEEDGSGSDYHTEYHEITTTEALPKTTIKTTTTSATTTRLMNDNDQVNLLDDFSNLYTFNLNASQHGIFCSN